MSIHKENKEELLKDFVNQLQGKLNQKQNSKNNKNIRNEKINKKS